MPILTGMDEHGIDYRDYRHGLEYVSLKVSFSAKKAFALEETSHSKMRNIPMNSHALQPLACTTDNAKCR